MTLFRCIGRGMWFCLPGLHLSVEAYLWWMLCRIEFLTHDISVHVPHHVSSKIPWYNLRLAHNSLKQNWGEVQPSLSAHA